MNYVRLLRSLVIVSLIAGFPGHAAARGDSAADPRSNADPPVSPEFEIIAEPDSDVFVLSSIGAPVYNPAVEAHAIVYLYGHDCMADGVVSARPIHYTYEPSMDPPRSARDSHRTSFTTRFGVDFEHVKAWFTQLRDAVGIVKGYCLNSVTLQHLIKVSFDRETGAQDSRYFLAALSFRDPIDSSMHPGDSNSSEIRTDSLNPDQWREKMKSVRLAGRIYFWTVSAEDIDRAKQYLTELSGASAPPAPPKNLRIIIN